MTGPDQQPDDQPGDRACDRLEGRLGDLATRIRVPEVPVTEDLARGHRRVRRIRLLTVGAAVATAVAVGLGAQAVPGVLHAGDRPGYSGRTGAPRPDGTDPTADATGVRPSRVVITPSGGPHGSPFQDPPSMEALSPTLAEWQRVLAEHLDPGWQHLVKYDAKTNGNVQSASSGSATTSLGSKYGWQVAGESGLGMLQLSVNASWQGLYWECGTPGSGWACHTARGPQREKARVARHDGVLDVAVEHADGEVVVLTADSLFGNNSTVPVSGLDVTEKGLVEAAADERLALPGGLPDFPPALTRGALEQAGRDALGGPGESLRALAGGGGHQAWMQADWRGPDGARGRLDWNADAREVGAASPAAGGYECQAAVFTRCTLEPVGDRRVFVGRLRAKAGGGWQVEYAGAAYRVSVGFRPLTPGASFPLARAESLVLDDRLQTTG